MRKNKLLVIVSLVVAICVMTIGFAAFSATLTISSSATVTPNDDSLNLKLYGFSGNNYNSDLYDLNMYNNEFTSNILDTATLTFSGKTAVVDSENLSLNMGTINIKSPGDIVVTAMRLVNNGEFDVYLHGSQFIGFSPVGTCIAEEGTSQELVDATCQNIIFATGDSFMERTLEAKKAYFEDKISYEDLESIISEDCFSNGSTYCVLEKGESFIFTAGVAYRNEDEDNMVLADGPFSVSFSDFKIEFTTTPPGDDS